MGSRLTQRKPRCTAPSEGLESLHCTRGNRFADAQAVARDAKTALQEWAQARKQEPPRYEVIARQGPDHAPIFEIEVQLDSGQTARAKDRSKRAAQQSAAEQLLSQLEGQA